LARAASSLTLDFLEADFFAGVVAKIISFGGIFICEYNDT
jgi:hypothetical protein